MKLNHRCLLFVFAVQVSGKKEEKTFSVESNKNSASHETVKRKLDRSLLQKKEETFFSYKIQRKRKQTKKDE